MPFGSEVAAATILLVITVLATIWYWIVKGDGHARTTLPSDHGPDISAVLAAIEDLKSAVQSHEASSQQRMQSLTNCLKRSREQQEIDDRFKALQKEIDRLRNVKPD